MPLLERHCAAAGGVLDITRCSATADAVHNAPLERHLEILRPGKFISFGEGSPEWFYRDDGTLLANNGTATSLCNGVPEALDFVSQQVKKNAPKRGTDAKSYEGTWKPDGSDFLYPDCSEFEIRVGRIVGEAFSESERKHGDRAIDFEEAALKEAARRAKVPRKMADEIWAKTSMTCMEAILGSAH